MTAKSPSGAEPEHDWRLHMALDTYRSLETVIHQLTDTELHQVILLEESGQRRKTVLRRLQREGRQRAKDHFTKKGVLQWHEQHP